MGPLFGGDDPLPQQTFMYAWLVAVALSPLITLLHETGHLLVARMAGFSVRSISLGSGRVLLNRRLGSMRLIVHAMPVGGLTHYDPKDSPTVARREALVCAAGPVTDLVVAAGALALATHGHPLAIGVAWYCALSVVLNLWPRSRMLIAGDFHANDGWRIIRSLKGEVSPAITLRRAEALRRDGHLEESLALIAALAENTGISDAVKRNLTAVWLISIGRFEEARALCIADLVQSGGGFTPQQRAYILNNAAYSGVLARNPAHLMEDRAAAVEALQLIPDNHSLKNTLGLCLILTGDLEDGRAWCQQAMAQVGTRPAHQAIRLASLAVADAVAGDVVAVDSGLAAAMHIDTSVEVMSLAALAYSRVLGSGVVAELPHSANGVPEVPLCIARCDALVDLGRWSEMGAVATQVLEAAGTETSRDQRATLCNLVAWAGLMTADERERGAVAAAVAGLEAIGYEHRPAYAAVTGWWYIENGDVPKGVELCRQALLHWLSPPENVTALAALALGLQRSGNLDEARLSVAAARRIDGSAPIVARATAATA